MNQSSLFDNTPVHKLNRTEAPDTSKAAAKKGSSGELKKLVYDAVVAAGDRGITTKEIRALHPELPYSSVTARPAALEEDGLIFYREGDKRDGCRVMRDKALENKN